VLLAVPGAVIRPARAQPTCPALTPEQFQLQIQEAQLIVIGRLLAPSSGAIPDRDERQLQPEVFLKGNPSAATLRLLMELPGPCDNPDLAAREGARVLVITSPRAGVLPWPGALGAYLLADGQAHSLNRGEPGPVRESDLVDRIRGITNQYSIPAASDGEGEGIDWWTTIVPVGGAVLGIFIVGLFLMRIWHRIDPS
jgi:hypothetical protein